MTAEGIKIDQALLIAFADDRELSSVMVDAIPARLQ